MYFPQSHLDLVRCGIAIYGLSPGQSDAEVEGLRPALSWTAQVALVKRVPLVVFKPTPGQEDRNAEYLVKAGAARLADSVEEVAATVSRWLDHPDELERGVAQLKDMRTSVQREVPRGELVRLVGQALVGA